MDVNFDKKPPIIIVTGERGVGKSTYCQHKVGKARHDGRKVAGLLSIAQIRQGVKVGIEIEDLSSGERRVLASISPGSFHGPTLGPWFFDGQAIEWANQILERASPCDLLVVDELGVMEFVQEQGFLAAFHLLDGGKYQLAMIVVRPECLKPALERWPWAEEVWISKRLDPIQPESAN